MHDNRRAVAFVLNVSTPNGLGVIRSLGREGIPVVAVDHKPSAPGLTSRFCQPLITKDPVHDPAAVLQTLMEEGARLDQKGLLFPTSDAFVLFVSRYRKELAEHFSFGIPSERVLEGMIDKRRQYMEATRIGTPIATTFYPASMHEVMDIKDLLDYPAFIKPYYSHLWYERFGNKGFKVNGPKELVDTFHRVFEAKLDALVQSIIQGPNTNHVKVCAYYGTDGKLHALFLTRKIRQFPTEFGVGTVMHSFHDDRIIEVGLRFFEGIDYRGIGSIEFKLDDRDGQYKMIELNARIWMQNAQATYAGVNFPLIEYQDLTGQEVGSPPEYRDGVRWVDSFEDAQAFWWYRSKGVMTLPDLIQSWLNINCHAFFAWDDLRPVWEHVDHGVGLFRLPVGLLRWNKRDVGVRSGILGVKKEKLVLTAMRILRLEEPRH